MENLMVQHRKDTYFFSIKGTEYELFVSPEDGFIELYETRNPGKTGFYLEDKKKLNLSFFQFTVDLKRF
jgi:hypothetical protein